LDKPGTFDRPSRRARAFQHGRHRWIACAGVTRCITACIGKHGTARTGHAAVAEPFCQEPCRLLHIGAQGLGGSLQVVAAPKRFFRLFGRLSRFALPLQLSE
jgi:hypothetical protein